VFATGLGSNRYISSRTERFATGDGGQHFRQRLAAGPQPPKIRLCRTRSTPVLFHTGPHFAFGVFSRNLNPNLNPISSSIRAQGERIRSG
jgi:hypothetical protein